MKLAILGATGGTGLCLVQQALDEGHEVVAIMRNTSNYSIDHEKLKVVNGDIFSVDSLVSHFKGCDVVMSCLGTRTWFYVTIYSDTINVIIEATRKAGISRFIVVTSWCTSDNPKDRGPFLMEWVFKTTFLRSVLRDMAKQEQVIGSCSDINYSVVRPPLLTDEPVTDKEFKTEIDRLHVPGVGYSKIPRADVARFMLKCLKTDKYDRKMVAISL
ncbi:Flavin reductase (NADPH) [Holothuria leucospilota]|uniref:Flavin reductase (NADPH) n=1 Tax=Holothuria leucospilota TaxID=206669 RepID=A0A9Q1BHR2_HOLLE|nr:Flavin reductase (NADPH) [Holothuria leucospilota]